MSKDKLSEVEQMILDAAEGKGSQAWQRQGYTQPDYGALRIGSTVMVKVPKKRARAGVIVGESCHGSCWVVECGKDKKWVDFHKSYCEKVSLSRAVRKDKKKKGYVEDWEELERIKNGLLDDPQGDDI